MAKLFSPVNYRVRIVSAGVVCAAGKDTESVWRSACAPQPANQTENIRAGDTAYPVVVSRCSGDLAAGLDPALRRRLGRTHLLAIDASDQAIALSEWRSVAKDRRAIVIGVGFAEIDFLEEMYRCFLEHPRRVSPATIPTIMPSSVASHLARRYEAVGATLTVSTACASGADAIGVGAGLITSGVADNVLVVGVDSILTPAGLWFFRQLGALSTHTATPDSASRPFDSTRSGLVLGEGAAAVVLSAADSGSCLGELLGYASTQGGESMVAPGVEQAAQAMRLAIRSAGLEPSDIVAVSAHGTATVLNDSNEAAALHQVFTHPPPVTALKGVTGHLIGASGVLEAIMALRGAAAGCLPPTAGTQSVDPQIDIDLVVGESRTVARGPVMSDSFGFGGQNAVLVLAPAHTG